MNIFRAFTLILLITSHSLANSSASLHIQGTVKPVVTFTVTKESSKVYNITVLSNNPNGFTATVSTDTESKLISVPLQTETKTYNYTLSFTNAPSFVKVVVRGD